jgi:monothiol glutaredoxin
MELFLEIQSDGDLQKQIDHAVKSKPVLLFVKGSREFPQCGFSKGVMDVLDELGVKYNTVNVLGDERVRNGIKQYTQWPTIPQVFVRGEFIGGFDIVREMYMKGELQPLFKDSK